MELLREIREYGVEVSTKTPTVHCKVFEDNSGAIELAKLPKIRPRTKHINNQYHHFRDHVANGDVEIVAVELSDQLADILTKPLAESAFVKLRNSLMKWDT